jgi:hypothetical protein
VSIVSYQSGSITLADATASVTLGTTVTQGNSILIVSLRGGSNSVGQYNVRVTLSSDGTTVTATRATSGPDIIIEYQVIEASEFTVSTLKQRLLLMDHIRRQSPLLMLIMRSPFAPGSPLQVGLEALMILLVLK